MPGQGQLVKIGPFKGGLNTSSDASSISDIELSDLINLEIDLDGSLVSRPPIVADTAFPVAAQNMCLLGYFVDGTTGTTYLIGSSNSAIYYYQSGTWTLITTGFRAAAAVQYLNRMWFVTEPGSSVTGGQWSPGTGYANVATMPYGQSITVFKERLWIGAGELSIANTARVYFSNIASGTTWGASDFFDVVPGDGQKVIDMFVQNNNLYIFKNDSTYVFSYDSSPAKGVVNKVSGVVGASDIDCVSQYENIMYVYHENFLYELINYNYTKLNLKVDFEPRNQGGSFYHPVTLSVVGNRLILRYFESIYAFNVITRTWARWSASGHPAKFVKAPQDSTTNTPSQYFMNDNTSGSNVMYSFLDGYDPTKTEVITCYLKTKIFDFDTPSTFKKLYWWGVDLLAQGVVTASVTPVIFSSSITWDQLEDYTWDELAGNTWDQPLVPTLTIDSDVDTAGSYVRKFLKFLKAIRFRNVYFEISATCSGKPVDSPVKVFSINPMVNMKQQVPKEIN